MMQQLLDAQFALERGLVPAVAGMLSLGPRNTFVIRCGLTRNHTSTVIATCFGCDVAVIALAVFGFSAVPPSLPQVPIALKTLGIAYLLFIARSSLGRAWRGNATAAIAPNALAKRTAVIGALVVSLINPLVWAETALILGALSSTVAWKMLPYFAIGAAAGSLLKFGILGFGARNLAVLFARPGMLRGFDAFSGFAMIGMALAILTIQVRFT